MGFFHRTIRMVENGIKPAYVFDGKPPQLKSGVVHYPAYDHPTVLISPFRSLPSGSRRSKMPKRKAKKRKKLALPRIWIASRGAR
jgi:hypothetical protein